MLTVLGIDDGILKLEVCPEITNKSGQNKELKSAWFISNRTKSEVYSSALGTVCIMIPSSYFLTIQTVGN